MSTAPIESLPAAERRRLVVIGLLRASATTVMVVAAYYLCHWTTWSAFRWRRPGSWTVALTAVVAYQVRAIIRHRHSAVRAIRHSPSPCRCSSFSSRPYFMMEQANPDNLNVESLTRSDSLYFTVTVFATVGFGTSRRPARRPAWSSRR